MGSHTRLSLGADVLQEIVESRECLSWCLRRIRYPHAQPHDVGDQVTTTYMSAIIKRLQGCRPVLTQLQARVRAAVADTQGKDTRPGHWLLELACDRSELVKAGSLSNLILMHMSKVVRQPLAKLLYRLEQHSALSSLLHATGEEQQQLWQDTFLQQSVLEPEDAVPLREAKEGDVEIWRLKVHYPNLRWTLSSVIMSCMEERRVSFEQWCFRKRVLKDSQDDEETVSVWDWDPTRISDFKDGLCNFLLSSPILHNVAEHLASELGHGHDEAVDISLESDLVTHDVPFGADAPALMLRPTESQVSSGTICGAMSGAVSKCFGSAVPWPQPGPENATRQNEIPDPEDENARADQTAKRNEEEEDEAARHELVGDAQDNANNRHLHNALNSFWIKHRDDYLVDMATMVSESIVLKHSHLSLKTACALADWVLKPARMAPRDDWHPADLHVRCESHPAPAQPTMSHPSPSRPASSCPGTAYPAMPCPAPASPRPIPSHIIN